VGIVWISGFGDEVLDDGAGPDTVVGVAVVVSEPDVTARRRQRDTAFFVKFIG
jgi:hypothetical protein